MQVQTVGTVIIISRQTANRIQIKQLKPTLIEPNRLESYCNAKISCVCVCILKFKTYFLKMEKKDQKHFLKYINIGQS